MKIKKNKQMHNSLGERSGKCIVSVRITGDYKNIGFHRSYI